MPVDTPSSTLMLSMKMSDVEPLWAMASNLRRTLLLLSRANGTLIVRHSGLRPMSDDELKIFSQSPSSLLA